MYSITRITLYILVLCLLGGCAPATPAPAPAVMRLSSPAFADGALVPVQFTCTGADISPALHWDGLPPEVKSLALSVRDPDAPGGTFTHWVLFNFPATDSGLEEGSQAGTAGANSSGKAGYSGPCPPQGKPHHYVFNLYALDAPLTLSVGASYSSFEKALDGHILAQGTLTGLYGR